MLDSALVWVRCDGETTLRIQYTSALEWSGAGLSALVSVTQAADYTATVPLAGLKADTLYRYRIADGDGKPRDAAFATGAFRTAPAMDRNFSFVFSGDTHAWHKPFALFDLMRERKPDFFIHGDTAYVDSPRSQYRPALDYYRFQASGGAQRRATAAVPRRGSDVRDLGRSRGRERLHWFASANPLDAGSIANTGRCGTSRATIRREIVAFIRDKKIRNVVILSADLHAAGDLSDERTGLTEFLAGPIAAPLQPLLASNARTRKPRARDPMWAMRTTSGSFKSRTATARLSCVTR